MDANRKTVAVVIAGRTIDMLVPTEGQIVGLQMLQSNKLSMGAKLQGLSELFLALLPTDDDRSWFASQMASGDHTVDDFVLSLKAIASAPDVEPTEAGPAKKRAAKKTPAKKTTASR